MQPRAIHYVSALLVGLGIGVLVYRFGVLGLMWNGSKTWVFPGVAVGFIVGGLKLQSLDTQSERPAMATRIALAIVGIGISMGILYVLVPTLSRVTLERRALPGFSIDAPTDKAAVEVVDYNIGNVAWHRVGGANAVIALSWQVGSASLEELQLSLEALSAELGGSPEYLKLPGPNGTQVETVKVDTNKGVPLYMSTLPCGNRGVIVMTMGVDGIETVQKRMLASFVCTPDPTKELAEPGVVRVAIDLPGWYVDEAEHGQLTVTDGKAIIILREVATSQTKLQEMIVPLLNAFGGKVTAKPAVGDRVPFTGTIEDEHIEGWARRIVCPTHAVMVLAMANTVEDSEAAYVASSNAGCLRPGEKPPTFPAAPADEEAADEADADAPATE